MRRIGRYSLVEPLATGATSEVFLAKVDDQALATSPELRARTAAANGHVAVKIFRPHVARDPAFVELFTRETEAAIRFRHPACVGVLDAGTEDGAPFAALELVKGRTLADVMERARDDQRPIPREIALWIAAECASALRAAHLTPWVAGSSERMVHGGLSPSAILLSDAGRVKILGMGLGRSRARASSTLERLAYRAPEVIERAQLTPLADVYAIGVLVYDLLTNERVFGRATQAETEAAVLRGKFDRLGGRVEYISELVDELVWQMMSRFPESRPQSAEYVERALRSQVRFEPDVIATRIAEHLQKLFGKQHDPFGGNTEPMMQLLPPPALAEGAATHDPEPIDISIDDFDEKTPFAAPPFVPIERAHVSDPFEEATPVPDLVAPPAPKVTSMAPARSSARPAPAVTGPSNPTMPI
ncbi:serine/threonine protein kinase, partial [Myxococcota bacterium]|nr:serine/threonine protein kinase [Myxococcota bacterium]